jgi:hypothetical protein
MHAAFFRSLRRNRLIQQLRLWGNLRICHLCFEAVRCLIENESPWSLEQGTRDGETLALIA